MDKSKMTKTSPHVRSHDIIRQVAISTLCFFLMINQCFAVDSEPTPEWLLDKIISSEKAIEDITVNLKCFVPTRDNKLMFHWDWGYCKGKEFYSGTSFDMGDPAKLEALGLPDKTEDTNAFDGEKQYHLRLQEGSFPSGSIRAFDPSSFRGNVTPTTLLGFDTRELSRQTMGEALAGAGSISVKKEMEVVDGHSCYVIEAIGVETDPVVKWSYDVRVWIDAERGYRPLRFEKYYGFGGNNRWKVLSRRVDNIKLEKIDGIWLPIEGTRTTYKLGKLTRPYGMAEDEWESLSGKQKYQTGIFSNEPMANPKLLKIDRDSIRINKGIPDERFKINFPHGCVVWDDFMQVGYTIGGRRSVHHDVLNADDIDASVSSNLGERESENGVLDVSVDSQDQKNVIEAESQSDELAAIEKGKSDRNNNSNSMTPIFVGLLVILAIVTIVGINIVNGRKREKKES
jgi:hypothetical protein